MIPLPVVALPSPDSTPSRKRRSSSRSSQNSESDGSADSTNENVVIVAVTETDAIQKYASRRAAHEDTGDSVREVTTQTTTCEISVNQLGGLNALRQDVERDQFYNQILVGSTATTVSSLSVGYVIWLVRGGVLMSSVLSSLPAWHIVDPLPVLGEDSDDDESYLNIDEDNDDDDDDSLEQLVSKSPAQGIES